MDEVQKAWKAARRVRLLDAMVLIAGTAVVLAVSRGPEWMAMLWIWCLHSLIGAVLSAPIVLLGHKRVHWGLLDLLAFLLPFAAWGALMNFSSQGKSLANLAEPFFFGLAIPVAALVRVILGPHAQERAYAISLIGLLTLVAVSVYCWTPALPE